MTSKKKDEPDWADINDLHLGIWFCKQPLCVLPDGLQRDAVFIPPFCFSLSLLR
ncbi:hypothetical protein ACLK2E_22575 [Escherichia coli]